MELYQEQIKRVKVLINKTGWTHRKIGKSTGLTPNRIHDLLTARTKPRENEMESMIKVMEDKLNGNAG